MTQILICMLGMLAMLETFDIQSMSSQPKVISRPMLFTYILYGVFSWYVFPLKGKFLNPSPKTSQDSNIINFYNFIFKLMQYIALYINKRIKRFAICY